MLTRRRKALSGALIAVVALIASAPAHAAPEPPTPHSGEPRQSGLFATDSRLGALVAEKGALGHYYDERLDRFVVVLPASGPGSTRTAADFAVGGSAPVVKRSSTTRSQVDAVHERIRAEAARNSSAGHVYGSAFDITRDVVVVTSDAPPDLAGTLSAGLSVKVEHRRGTGGRNSRQFDPRPFRGGAAVTIGTVNCSSGFTVQDPEGNRYLLGAAHCGHIQGVPIGRPVENTGSGEHMGYFYYWNFPDRDIGLISHLETGFYGHHIYVGDATGKQIRVAGASDPVVNRSDYCRSGITTFEKCGQRVFDLKGQFCDKAGCTQDLIAYDKGTIAQGGDSGAPFYSYNADRTAVVVHGMHIAQSGGWQYAEKWSRIASSQGVSVVTAP
ncbi:S1 family peptidase [Saccharothrix algeriensis]|uniref:Serine protease n=2 Tax=Saccharothrix algeriensis TaxID=173560 RepID=A0ABS2S575_9PSEU|nr:S1 family peptidase [Saccharothrix algeriensis]MBM7810458.1 hypothetical protein [Saccharothrix algeriensis]